MEYKAGGDSWANIASFAQVQPKLKGVGISLFEHTIGILLSSHRNVKTINATIRADNTSGLSYYNKIGFVDYAVSQAIPISDGTLIDRLHKKYEL